MKKKLMSRQDKKGLYEIRAKELLAKFSKVLIAVADNVGSNQMQTIRQGLRGDSVILMGKNTLIRRVIRVYAEESGNQESLNLIPLIFGNVGLIFTKGDLKEVSEEVSKYKDGAPAHVGLVAPIDVVVPPGNTGLDPSQTSFFQVLNIPTKINKGTELPNLKQFKWNNYSWHNCGEETRDNVEAFGIAKTMHCLRSLQLFGNRISNEGLKAILEGCPYLETLDIRRCYNVKMNSDMRARCAKLTTLRLPNDT